MTEENTRGSVDGRKKDVTTDITLTSPRPFGPGTPTDTPAHRRSMARASGGRRFDRERQGGPAGGPA